MFKMEEKEIINRILKIIRSYQFPLENEKITQKSIKEAFDLEKIEISSEYYLDKNSIIDFFHPEGIGIEVKLKGSTVKIYDQCERYCQFHQIKTLILLTRKTMGMPENINGKKVIVVSLGEGWLS